MKRDKSCLDRILTVGCLLIPLIVIAGVIALVLFAQ